MTDWLLLFLTMGSAYLTYDAFRWSGSIERAPFSAISNMWKGGLSHLSIVEQNELKQRYASKLLGAGQLCWLFLFVTAVLAGLTVRAFMS
jgi:hypothetical protein